MLHSLISRRIPGISRLHKSSNASQLARQVEGSSIQPWMVSSSFSTVTAASVMEHESSIKVHVDKYSLRLPNNDRDRTFLAQQTEEHSRSMSGVVSVVRHDWTREEISTIYHLPLYDLLYRAATVHRMYWNPSEVQQCTLISIKTGGCTEDCSYCSQSSRYKTHVKPTPTLKVQQVLEAAQRAKDAGSTRFCMGAAWRELGNKTNAFTHILDMVRGVNEMGLEVCATLGMLTLDQAKALKEAGLTSYNHNLDTSPEHYPKVITTRTFQDRLDTLANVREAGLSVCCGGILGLGEKEMDRIGLLHVLATLPEHPESVPINALVSVQGTPLGNKKKRNSLSSVEEANTPSNNVTITPCGKSLPSEENISIHAASRVKEEKEGVAVEYDGDDESIAQVDAFDMARMIATARILMPRTMVRLSAGRMSFSHAEQFMMFQAGANSIFSGDTLLTTPNPQVDEDRILFQKLGLVGKPAHQGPLIAPAEVDGMVHITRVVHESFTQ